MQPLIRPYRYSDFDALVILWRVSREVSLPDLQTHKGHFFYEDIAYFKDHMLPEDQFWVTVNQHDYPTGFMAIRGDFINALYIHPDYWRKGLGTSLIEHARGLSPAGLWLYTLQANTTARAFYEKHGFTAVEFGISPPPESEPDVKYAWRPS